MNREQKTATVEAIAEQIEAADAVFAVDYRGISVPQAAALRVRLREADATLRIVKNSLTERAAERAGADSLRALLEGPTALTFVRGDAALAAKALADFGRAEVPIEFKGGLMGGEELTVDQLKSIARLPARDVLYTQVVGTVAAPLTGLVRGLNGLLSGLAVQLQQIADRGLLGGGEAAEAEPAPTAEPAPDVQEPETAVPEAGDEQPDAAGSQADDEQPDAAGPQADDEQPDAAGPQAGDEQPEAADPQAGDEPSPQAGPEAGDQETEPKEEA